MGFHIVFRTRKIHWRAAMMINVMEKQQQNEARLEGKVRELFSDIPGLSVTVNCDVENRTVHEDSTKYDPKTSMSKDIETRDQTTETHSAAANGAEPGTGANTAASINGGGGGDGTSSTTEDQTTKSQIFASNTVTHTDTPAGKEKVLSATVRVPRSHMVTVLKTSNPTGEVVDEAALQPVATIELGRRFALR